VIYSFAPIVSKKSKVLILGSMPGVTSLNEREYYAYSRNQFWYIMKTLFNIESYNSYNHKINSILENKMALWDTIKSCKRVNSSDSNITDEVANNFKWLFMTYTEIEYIFFNGTKAEKVFRRYINKELYNTKHLIRLPSTSPANTQKISYKLKKWKLIKGVLH
jgi:TDG/mug DNA glycosylase family protein